MTTSALSQKTRGAGQVAGCVPGCGGFCDDLPPGRSKRRAARFELRPAELFAIFQHRLSVGDDHLVLLESERHWVAVDHAAEILADVVGAPLFTGWCDGLKVRFTVIENDAVDDVVEALKADGHGVAVAARVEAPDAGGLARTAVVRKWRPRLGASEGSPGTYTAEELRGLAAKLHAMIEQLYPDMRAVAISTIKRWLDALLHEQVQRGDAGLWPAARRESLTPFHLITDMAAAMAPLSEDQQQAAVRMVHRFRELLPEHGSGVVQGEIDGSDDEDAEESPRLCIARAGDSDR